MKKLIVLLGCVILLTVGLAYAQEEQFEIPTRHGLMYLWEDSKLEYTTEYVVFDKMFDQLIPGGLELNAFYTSQEIFGLGVNYHLLNLADIMDVPLAKYVDV